MLQTTFTRQKRELTKAVHWTEKLRAQRTIFHERERPTISPGSSR